MSRFGHHFGTKDHFSFHHLKKYLNHDSDLGKWGKFFQYLHHKYHHDHDQDQGDPDQNHTVHDEYRTIDGTGNNESDPNLGSTHELFLRNATHDYGNGISTPAGDDRPSARVISNELMDQEGDVPNIFGASDFLWVWGQFLDHDIDLTLGGGEEFNIPVPLGDPFFDPFFTGTQEIGFTRSGFAEGTGETNPGQQMNEITAFIDASQVYGSDQERADFLRDPDNAGKLKLSEDGYMPLNTEGFPNAMSNSPNFFLAGDVRANENVALISMQTLFVREHNRLVDELTAKHPEWDSDTLYEEAKLLVEAEIQHITYEEYLPFLLGDGALEDYSGYKADVDPSIANIFATAAFRFGHSQLSSLILRTEENGDEFGGGHLGLRDAFFRPDVFLESGVDPILRGVAENVSQSIDVHVVDDVRNFLFGPPGAGGFDLASLNIQRGRDHGLPDYNTTREAYGLKKVTDFDQISSDLGIQQTLESLYGTVDNIDAWVGGLAEDLFGDSMLGELFTTVLVDQFTRLRDGDRLFYEERLNDHEIELIQDLSLADIIKLNSGIEHIQDNVFEAYDRMGGTWGNDKIMGDGNNELMMGEHGRDKLYGNGGDDYLIGGNGHDKLKGGNGEDVLHGGRGYDKMWGGDGSDIFRFDIFETHSGRWQLEDGKTDKIYDFSLSEDDVLEFNIEFGETKPDLDEITHVRERGDNLVIKFDGGGIIKLFGFDDTTDINEIATVDMV